MQHPHLVNHPGSFTFVHTGCIRSCCRRPVARASGSRSFCRAQRRLIVFSDPADWPPLSRRFERAERSRNQRPYGPQWESSPRGVGGRRRRPAAGGAPVLLPTLHDGPCRRSHRRLPQGLATGDAIGKQTINSSHQTVLRWYPQGSRGFRSTPVVISPDTWGPRTQSVVNHRCTRKGR